MIIGGFCSAVPTAREWKGAMWVPPSTVLATYIVGDDIRSRFSFYQACSAVLVFSMFQLFCLIINDLFTFDYPFNDSWFFSVLRASSSIAAALERRLTLRSTQNENQMNE